MKKRFNKLNLIIGFLASLIAVITFIIMFIPKSSNNLAGEWLMTSNVTNADMKAYIGAEIEWKMFITECDNKIQGVAEKITINGVDVDYNQRTSMELNGIIEENKLIINFVENGKVRKTSGIIIARFKDDTFSGNFSQTASSTKGNIRGLKILN